MIRITLQIDGEDQFNRTFTRFTEFLTDLRQIWPGVITEFRQIEKEQFAGEGVGQLGRWKPLSARYAKWKAKKYPGKPILQREGRLVESLTRNSPDSVVNPQREFLEIGTSVEYAAYHHRGVKNRLAQRKVIDFNDTQKNRIMKVIQRRMLSAGRENGFTLK